jgi:tetratricopeptide (TPR) repeat protein
VIDDRTREASPPAAEPQDGEGAQRPTRWAAWSDRWQIPTILASLALIVLGLWVVRQRVAQPDLATALTRAESLLDRGDLAGAARHLDQDIHRAAGRAGRELRARYHALVGDWAAARRFAEADRSPASALQVVEHYHTADSLGRLLVPEQVEQWAEALVDLGRLDEARHRAAVLEGLAVQGEGGDAMRRRRNRVLRRITETSLEDPDRETDDLIALLERYRADRMLRPPDELWAVARQAELRLDAGRTQEAVDHLLIDMRRVEQRTGDPATLEFGAVYGLLGRGYLELGRYDHAEFALRQALLRLGDGDPVRGDAFVLLGRLSMERGITEEALELMDEVVREYPGARAHLPALLGRAEIRSILGDHEGSLRDYEALRRAMMDEQRGERTGRSPELAPADAARSLVRRHDVALSLGDFELALRCALLAERFFPPDAVPSGILGRIAGTARRRADAIIHDALEGMGDATRDLAIIDPEVRADASQLYEQAGTYYDRRTRTITAEAGDDDSWAESLWLAADSFDLAGRTGEAIDRLLEYLDARPDTDPRRPQVLYRLAQAYHARLEWLSAAARYEELIARHSRSTFATRSAVPLAQVYVQLDRRADAIQCLRGVLSGGVLEPDARDYRDALIELGRVHHESGNHLAAIERLDEARQRYPEDRRFEEILYRLADASRLHARDLRRRVETELTHAPRDAEHLAEIVRSFLAQARDLYASVCSTLDADLDRRAAVDRDLLRNAMRFRADCAYELEDYREAIEIYDQLARRFPDEYAAIHALIQVHNAYVALGEVERAGSAQRRARQRLAQMPDDVFEDPAALLDRAAWERWLANSPLGRTVDATPGDS